MSYEWDQDKARANRQKHGVRFSDAVAVFMDDLAITIPDEYSYEERFVILGKDGLERVLVVVFTYRGDETRLISARKANAQERQLYEEQQ